MTDSPTLFDFAERDAALRQVATNAGSDFMRQAKAFVLEYLETHGQASGEALTDSCIAAGIVPTTTTKAFGAVYGSLSREKLIVKCGDVPRRKGHCCAGATLWRLSPK